VRDQALVALVPTYALGVTDDLSFEELVPKRAAIVPETEAVLCVRLAVGLLTLGSLCCGEESIGSGGEPLPAATFERGG
jgi:hypothetical protein